MRKQQLVEKPIPKGWKKTGGSCYEDENGIGHIILKKFYTSSEASRKSALKYGKENRKRLNKQSKLWQKRNPEKIKQANDKNNKKYGDCIRRIKRMRMKASKPKHKKRESEGYCVGCSRYQHKRCKNVDCICDCQT